MEKDKKYVGYCIRDGSFSFSLSVESEIFEEYTRLLKQAGRTTAIERMYLLIQAEETINNKKEEGEFGKRKKPNIDETKTEHLRLKEDINKELNKVKILFKDDKLELTTLVRKEFADMYNYHVEPEMDLIDQVSLMQEVIDYVEESEKFYSSLPVIKSGDKKGEYDYMSFTTEQVIKNLEYESGRKEAYISVLNFIELLEDDIESFKEEIKLNPFDMKLRKKLIRTKKEIEEFSLYLAQHYQDIDLEED